MGTALPHGVTFSSLKVSAASGEPGSLSPHNHPLQPGIAKVALASLWPPTCTELPSSTEGTWAPSAPKSLTSTWHKGLWLRIFPSKVTLHQSFIGATNRLWLLHGLKGTCSNWKYTTLDQCQNRIKHCIKSINAQKAAWAAPSMWLDGINWDILPSAGSRWLAAALQPLYHYMGNHRLLKSAK